MWIGYLVASGNKILIRDLLYASFLNEESEKKKQKMEI